MLYVKILIELYSLLKIALLFDLKLLKYMYAYGLKVNPYDPCVANMMVDEHQMTVTYHTDDLKVFAQVTFPDYKVFTVCIINL